MTKYSTLTALFTDIADAIREKKESTDPIIADNFPAEIDALRTRFDYVNPDVTEIPDYAFYGCEDLKRVELENVTKIGISAFEDCTNLKEVVLHSTIESMGENAFKGCSCIIRYMDDSIPETWNENWNPDGCIVILGNPIAVWDISATDNDNVVAALYPYDNMKRLHLLGTGATKSFFTGIAASGNYTFNHPWEEYLDDIAYANIDQDVTSLGYGIFVNCSNLNDIEMHENILYIGKFAFAATAIKSISIPNGISIIERDTFVWCKQLEEVRIPKSIISISKEAFGGCGKLETIYYDGNVAAWKAIQRDDLWIVQGPSNYTIHCTDGDIAKDGTVTYHTTT